MPSPHDGLSQFPYMTATGHADSDDRHAGEVILPRGVGRDSGEEIRERGMFTQIGFHVQTG